MASLPVIPIDPAALHKQRAVDFADEDNVKKYMRSNRFLSLDLPGTGIRLVRTNWLVFVPASIFLWAFVIAVLTSSYDDDKGVNQNSALEEFGMWMTWIAQNFNWLYIATQNGWFIFVVYMGLSRFGSLKLGKDKEQPVFNNLTWFSMLFCSGIGIGLYQYGVAEPIFYYRGYGNKLFKVPWQNDDQFAQQALFITLYHWGLHAWGCYILVALTLGFVAFRWDMPMTLRMAFFPLLGDVVHGLLGDFIDFISIACTTFGVCTSLGMGVDIIFTGLRRLDCGHGGTCASDIPTDHSTKGARQWKAGIICVITLIATLSVVTGLDKGLKRLSQLTFGLGNLLLFMLLYLDNTWFLLNSYVQSLGHYLTYVIQVGFQCDTFETLNLEFAGNSKLWDQNVWREGKWTGKVYDVVMGATGNDISKATNVDYGSHASWFIEWWTIFYWGWWVSWAPFVGIFIATISRGRTIRQVVFGAFLAPIVYSFFFLIVLGSLGIKMQRVAELGLDTVFDAAGCKDNHYVGGIPTSEAALGLANQGYFALQCRSSNDRFWDVLSPYGEEIFMFLAIISIIGVTFYFITSSDSGSFVDDTISAGGLLHCPQPQRIYWAVTEGACAIALMYGGGSKALQGLRAVSIVSGLPLTIAICYMCASLHRACKFDLGEEDILKSTRFITGLFDWTEGFQPNMPAMMPEGVKLPGASERAGSLAASIFLPFFTLHDMTTKLWGKKNAAYAAFITAVVAVLFCTWIGCMIGELASVNASYVGWTAYTGMTLVIAYVRIKSREAYNVYGFWLEDLWACLTFWPFVCSQLSLQAKYVEGDPPVDINADPNANLYDDVVPEKQVLMSPVMQAVNEKMMSPVMQAGNAPQNHPLNQLEVGEA